jgi:hypothetical protein
MNWLTSRKVCVIEYHGYDTLVVVKFLSSSAVCSGVNVAQSFSFLSIAFCGLLFFRFDHCIVFPPVFDPLIFKVILLRLSNRIICLLFSIDY